MRAIICRELDSAGCALRTGKGQPMTSRIVLEVAASRHMRPASRARRFRTLWHFAAWEETGHLAHMSTHQTRKAALALFNRPVDVRDLPTLALYRDSRRWRGSGSGSGSVFRIGSDAETKEIQPQDFDGTKKKAPAAKAC